MSKKNHNFLIDIFSEIRRINNSAFLLLIGTGPLEDNIKDKIKKLNLQNNVLLLGQRNDVSDLMLVMDVLVLPSLYEGLPVVGIEAQATGLPCFFSDKITKEVSICNSTFTSLDDSSEKWAKNILDFLKTFKRVNTVNEVIKSGFGIKTESQKLQNFYCELKKQDQ